MYVVGIDLSGPANAENTGVAVFEVDNGALNFVESKCDGSDAALLSTVKALSCEKPVVVGIDAPLSYQPGGGQRVRDADLRRRIVERRMHPGSVMAATAPRMVYLALRGIALARVLSALKSPHPVRIVEVHPGASLCLRGAPVEAIKAFGKDSDAREKLLEWLRPLTRGLTIPSPCSSHFVAACAGAIAAWDWHCERSPWVARAELPWHPYDFAS